MRFLPLFLPGILSYVVGVLLMAAPALIQNHNAGSGTDAGPQLQAHSAPASEEPGDSTEMHRPQARCGEPDGVIAATAPGFVFAVQRGMAAQLALFVFQFTGAALALFRPQFLEMSESELLIVALQGLATR